LNRRSAVLRGLVDTPSPRHLSGPRHDGRHQDDDRQAVEAVPGWVFTQVAIQRMARKIGADESWMADHARAAVESIVDVWNDSGAALGYDHKTREIIANHMKRVPLLRR
jgi:hypothetical protein